MGDLRLAVFDLDGTLLDTLEDLANAANYALREAGFPLHSIPEYRMMVGRGARNLINNAIPVEYRDDDAVLQPLSASFQRYYDAHSRDFTKPYDGIPQMLRTLRDRGCVTAILSNKPEQYVPKLVDRYFHDTIDFAAGQRENIPMKPDPQALLAIVAQYGVAADQVAYVGDSAVDIKTGLAAQIFTVGVTWGFRTRQELLDAGALVIVDKVADLEKILVDFL